jgi:hypothetical protein
MQLQRALRALESYSGQPRLLVVTSKAVQSIHDQQRRPIVVGIDRGTAIIKFDRLFKIAFGKRLAGVVIMAFIRISIKRDSTFEFSDGVCTTVIDRKSKAMRRDRTGNLL